MAVYKRYTSAAYEDKYFPEKNASIPFKWEITPGRTKHDDEENGDHTHSLHVHAEEAKDNSITEHHINQELSLPNIKCDKKDDELISSKKDDDGSFKDTHTDTDTPHAVSIRPLPLPPKLSPASPLRVKDLLQHASAHGSWLHDDDDLLIAHDDDCPLHTFHHWFPWFPFRFQSFKATSIVPIHNNTYCVIKPQPPINDPGLHKFQASPLVPGAPLQGRSHSFSHACRHGSDGELTSASLGRALKPAPERRCNSFNSLSAPHHTIFEHDEEYDDQSSVATVAAAAMWAGACILTAAAADHPINDPCKVARKLRDLMQQSANFSELGLPAPYWGTPPPPTKKRTKSEEEEEAFLKQDARKSCNNMSKCCAEARELSKVKADLAADGLDLQPGPHKLVKRKGYFALFKNECIGCWCPSSTY